METLALPKLVCPDSPEPRPLVAVDLFSGAGGLSQGFINGGFLVPIAVESERWATETYEKNHSTANIVNDDIRRVCIGELSAACIAAGKERPDVVMGGPPCQGFSRANRQTRSMENPLNSLFRDFLRIASELQPRAIVFENVVDLQRFDSGSIVAEIRTYLQERSPIKYVVNSAKLNASDYGVPQRRNRLFIVAVEQGLHFKFPTRHRRPPVTLWQAISDLPRLKIGNRRDEMLYRSYLPQNEYQALMRQGCGRTVRNNSVSKNGALVVKRYKFIRPGGNWRDIPDDLMLNYSDKSRTHNWIYLRLREGFPSVTIMHFRKSMLIHPRQHRGLSVREAARIQSFPDSYIFHGPLMYQQQQVANAVPPLLAQAVAAALRTTLE